MYIIFWNCLNVITETDFVRKYMHSYTYIHNIYISIYNKVNTHTL